MPFLRPLSHALLFTAFVASLGSARADALEERTFTATVADPLHAVVVLQNRGAASVELEPRLWNGRLVLHDAAEIDVELAALPAEPAGDTLALRIFRFVTENRKHGKPLASTFAWALAPPLFFDSLGVGLCGDAAELVAQLATARGLPARVVPLDGHVVAEVYEGGRWKMLDADYGVYFLDDAGEVASVAALENDASLVTAPHLWLPTPGPYSPYTAAYATLLAPPNGTPLAPLAPPAPRTLRFLLPRGASLRFPARLATPPRTQIGPLFLDYRDAALRLPAGVTGVIENALAVHTLRGRGRVEIDGATYTIGSTALKSKLESRDSAIATLRIVESTGPIEILYLINPLRWPLFGANELEAGASPGAVLSMRGLASGVSGSDSDGDTVGDDGNLSGVVGDHHCAGSAQLCDDNCPFTANTTQRDTDIDGLGNACDGDLDGDELLSLADRDVLASCRSGGAPVADPTCQESDLDGDGDADASDDARWLALVDETGGLADPPPPGWQPPPPPPPPAPPPSACGLGPELGLAVAGLAALRRRRRA